MFKKIYNLPYIDVVVIEKYNNLQELIYVQYINGLMTSSNIAILYSMMEHDTNNMLSIYNKLKNTFNANQTHEDLIKMLIDVEQSKNN